MAGPDVAQGVCDTPVSLLDLSATIAEHFGTQIDDGVGDPLGEIAANPDPDRAVFSEYHAAGAVSGAFMLRKGRWKLIRYVGFEDELFDLENDPEELVNVAVQHIDVVTKMRAAMDDICDIEQVNAQAFADQAALIEFHGGRDAALALGAPGATPPPKT